MGQVVGWAIVCMMSALWLGGGKNWEMQLQIFVAIYLLLVLKNHYWEMHHRTSRWKIICSEWASACMMPALWLCWGEWSLSVCLSVTHFPSLCVRQQSKLASLSGKPRLCWRNFAESANKIDLVVHGASRSFCWGGHFGEGETCPPVSLLAAGAASCSGSKMAAEYTAEEFQSPTWSTPAWFSDYEAPVLGA